jgi:hypothetical protein
LLWQGATVSRQVASAIRQYEAALAREGVQIAIIARLARLREEAGTIPIQVARRRRGQEPVFGEFDGHAQFEKMRCECPAVGVVAALRGQQ